MCTVNRSQLHNIRNKQSQRRRRTSGSPAHAIEVQLLHGHHQAVLEPATVDAAEAALAEEAVDTVQLVMLLGRA